MMINGRLKWFGAGTAALAAVVLGAVVVMPLAAGGDDAETGAFADAIAVHGDWTVSVIDPDGTVVERYDFQNALHDAGASTLIELLASNASSGGWNVVLSDSAGTDHICALNDGTTPNACELYESDAGPGGAAYQNRSVTVSAVDSDDDGLNDRLTLSAHVDAALSGSVGRVITGLDTCAASTAPADCGATGFLFTERFLDTSVPVAAGQRVAITVDISFSSP